MKKITADYVFTLAGHPIDDVVIVADDQGLILSVDSKKDHDPSSVQKFSGILCPGFINSHCHLELSHMKGLVDTGTGLLSFLQQVVKYRNFPEEVIQDAIRKADQEMFDGGIVAVGDISNKTDTFETKRQSLINYYTFVEMFDFMSEAMTNQTIEQYQAVHKVLEQDGRLKKSYVPHAPYTVSDPLYHFIKQSNPSGSTVSIHNQETEHEDAFFKHKSGGFLDFYQSFGIDFSHFKATGGSSLQYAINHLDPDQKNLFVHNTLTTSNDVQLAHSWSDQVYWATCPNANLYIENRLPDYQVFMDQNAKMTIGTDSLTSNWQLSILEEMKTIKKYNSFVSTEMLLTWACLNGAEALGYDELGSIEKGKTPGIVQITDIEVKREEPVYTAASRANRLV